ncbi:MAG: PmoA family protein [Verrucomicrobiales bacterium]
MRQALPIALLLSLAPLIAEESGGDLPPRCEIIPLADHQFSFRIDGNEITRWHHGPNYPRPFFFPFNGPSGVSLTRMGHPGAPNHDHHQSIWFAHNDVEGQNFWANSNNGEVRQKQWLAIQDGDEEAILAVLLGWYDPAGTELLEQEVVAAIRPASDGGHELEIQSTLKVPEGREPTRLEKTNFGLLAVRVAKSISARFGGGGLANSESASGEKSIFGKQARWMDYSGPVAVTRDGRRAWTTEGITFFDHPENPNHPSHWHVRDDGWMGASFCFAEGFDVAPDSPLTLRYLLRAHAGDLDPDGTEEVFQAFSRRPGFVVGKASRPHHQFGVKRAE